MLCPNCQHEQLIKYTCPICGFYELTKPCNTLVKVYPGVVSGIEVFVAFGSIQDGTLTIDEKDVICLDIAEGWGYCMLSTEVIGRELCR